MYESLEGAREWLAAIATELDQTFVERSEVVEGALAALLAGQHRFFHFAEAHMLPPL